MLPNMSTLILNTSSKVSLLKRLLKSFEFSIVGNADGGKMMSEREFEEFKKNVREARKNRLYVNFRNAEG
jgi:hypothetical protein